MNLNVKPAHPDDAYALSGSLCESDNKHLEAIMGEEFYPEYRGYRMEEQISSAFQAFSITDNDNRILGIWGHDHFCPVLNWGEVWLMSAPELFSKHLRELTDGFRRYIIPKLEAEYDVVSCTVRKDNEGLRRWLSKSGFTETYNNTLGGESFALMTRGLK